jgi:hypothetical protein
MKNTTKAAGIAGIVMGALGIAAATVGALAKGKDDKVTNANEEFNTEFDNFCKNNGNEETYTTPPAGEQEAEAPAEEG